MYTQQKENDSNIKQIVTHQLRSYYVVGSSNKLISESNNNNVNRQGII